MALTWEQHQKNIFGGESGGDYDALFGYQNRPNGAFSNVKVSDMSLAQVLDFTNPKGAYGQYVAKNRPDPEMGVATPVGAYQVVGSTLRKAIDALGLDPNQKFDKATQDKIGQYILKTQGTGAWEGYGKGGASMQNKPAQSNAQGFLGGLLGGQGIGGALGLSDDMRDKLRMGILAGSDPRAFAGQIAAAQQSIATRGEERRKQQARNVTADYLDSIGQTDAAKLLREGAISASDAFALGKPKDLFQYQQKAKDILNAGLAKTEAEALEMALSSNKNVTQVNVGGGSDKQVFDAVAESADAAKKARTALKSLSEAQSAAEGMFAGVGAEQRLQLAKLAAFTGFRDFDQAIQDTETFKTQIAPQVAFLLKQTVGSTQVSDQDRKFATQAAAGDITFDKGALIRVLNIMERMSNAVISDHSELMNSVYPEGQGFDRERALFGVTYDPAKTGPAVEVKPSATPVPPPTLPKVGDIMDGHRYKGGDPSKQSSWEPI